MGPNRLRFIRFVVVAVILGISCSSHAQTKPPAKASPAFENHPAFKLMQQLEKRANVRFDQVTLAEAIDALKTEHNLPLVIQRNAIDLAGIDPETKITIDQKNVKLDTALRLLLRPMDMTIKPDGSWLMVTTVEDAENNPTPVNYPVWDLVKPTEGDQIRGADYDSLIEAITITIAPESWEEVGGTGTVVAQKGILTIAQTVEIHRSVSRLIDALRSLPIAADAKTDTLPESIALRPQKHGPKPLAAPAVLRFDEVELENVAQQISSKYDVRVVIDEAAFSLAGLDISQPITCNLAGANLGPAMRMMLSEFDLTFIVKDELVVITTVEEAEVQLSTRVYPIAGLLDNTDPDYNILIDNITSVIKPESWEEVGSTGSLTPFPNRACLMISQTDDVHEKVDAHLQDLFAKAEDTQVIRKQVDIAAETIVTHIYKIPTKKEEAAPDNDQQARRAAPKNINAQFGGGGGGFGGGGGMGGFMPAPGGFASQLKSVDSGSLLSLIARTIPNKDWNLPDARIVALPDRLYVRCRHDIHKTIQDLLDELSVTTLNPYGAREPSYPMGGGMGGCGMSGGGMGGGGLSGGGLSGGGMGGGGIFSVGNPTQQPGN